MGYHQHPAALELSNYFVVMTHRVEGKSSTCQYVYAESRPNNAVVTVGLEIRCAAKPGNI